MLGMAEERSCKNCRYGSYVLTFDDGTHLDVDGKDAMLCVLPEGKECNEEYSGWQPREK